MDGIVGALDPSKSGIIRLSTIHMFGKELSDYKVIESQSSGIDDVGDHQEETVHIKSPMELISTGKCKSKGDRFKFNQQLSPHVTPPTLSSGDSKSGAEMSIVPEENVVSSDSELDFNKVMQSM